MVSPLYEPLPTKEGQYSLRILDLFAGEAGTPIRCALRTVFISENPQYDAISYCWGSQASKREIFCNELELEISQSLYVCLGHLRDTKVSRSLWADAICINQEDTGSEKGHQVNIMREIYKQANCVIVWLGEEYDDSSLGINCIQRLLQTQRKMKEAGDNRGWSYMSRADEKKYGVPKYRGKEIIAFLHLLNRPWFQRVWVIQEITASSDAILVCGSSQSTWKDFTDAVEFIGDLDMTYIPFFVKTPTGLDRLRAIMEAQSKFSLDTPEDLIATLNRYRNFQATNPRDKVFAILNLSTDSATRGLQIVPDYQTSVEDVYLGFATRIIETCENLDILSVPRGASEKIGSPSWVPNWAVDSHCWPLVGVSDPRASHFKASGDTINTPTFSGNKRSLGLSGHVVDSFKRVEFLMDAVISIRSAEENILKALHRITGKLLDWELFCEARSGRTYVTGEAILDVYWQTLICGYSGLDYETNKKNFDIWDSNVKKTMPLIPFVSRNFEAEWIRKAARSLVSLSRLIPGDSLSSGQFASQYSEIISGRTIFETEKGYIGLCSKFAEVGDKIVLVKGSKTPLVMREKEGRWVFVGDCYVHGIMHGEAFDEEACGMLWVD